MRPPSAPNGTDATSARDDIPTTNAGPAGNAATVPDVAPAGPVPDAVRTGAGTPIAVEMRRNGIDRRRLLRWSAYMAGVLALPMVPYGARIAEAMETQTRLPILWLRGQNCDGNIEALLRASEPTPSELILDRLSLEYVELLMAASGASAHDQLAESIAKYFGGYVLVVEGSIPMADGGAYCCAGGQPFDRLVREAAAGALAVIAAGSCAADGGLPAAAGGVTGAVSLGALLGYPAPGAGASNGAGGPSNGAGGAGSSAPTAKFMAFPGCPMNVENITAAIVQYLTLGEWPETDAAGLPLFAYGARIHPSCERLPFLREGKVALEWGDEGHRSGWCLRRIGCQGPSTSGNCSTVKFNGGTSWPVSSGSPCIGCTTPGFWNHLSSVVSWSPPSATPPEPNPAPTASPTPTVGPTPAAAG